MNATLIEDLKQFIEATVHQATADLATKDDIRRLDGHIDELRDELHTTKDEILDAIGNTIVTLDTATNQRVDKLEARTA